jgi:hypothetical protein
MRIALKLLQLPFERMTFDAVRPVHCAKRPGHIDFRTMILTPVTVN